MQDGKTYKDPTTRRAAMEASAETTTLLQTHSIEKEKSTPYARPWMKPGAEIAIVGFWKQEN